MESKTTFSDSSESEKETRPKKTVPNPAQQIELEKMERRQLAVKEAKEARMKEKKKKRNRKVAARARFAALALVTETVPAKYAVQDPGEEEPKIFFAKALTYLRASSCDLVLACLDKKSGKRQIVECLKDELIGDCYERIDHENFGYESVEAMDFLHKPIHVGVKHELREFFHKPWVEYDGYKELDANGWSMVIPLYISDRARDEDGNYFVHIPSMHYQLDTGERDNICFQEEPTDFPVNVRGGVDGDKAGSSAPPPDETTLNAATSESGGGDGHHVPPPW